MVYTVIEKRKNEQSGSLYLRLIYSRSNQILFTVTTAVWLSILLDLDAVCSGAKLQYDTIESTV